MTRDVHTYISYQVAWQQEVRDALPDVVLVATVAAHQLPFHHLRLHQQRVQVFERLVVVTLQFLCRGRLRGQLWEAQLF